MLLLGNYSHQMKWERQNAIGLFCNVLAWGICLVYIFLCLFEIYIFWVKKGGGYQPGRLFSNVLLMITVVTLFASKEERVWAVPSSIFVTGWLYPLYGCLRQKFDLGLLVDTSSHWVIALIVYVLFRYAQGQALCRDNEEFSQTGEGEQVEV